MMKVADVNGGPASVPGTRRWIVEWGTPAQGHDGPECEDHFIEECYDAHERAFPSRGLARAYAKRKLRDGTPLFFGCVCVREETFDKFARGLGSWEEVGEREEFLR